MKKYIILLAVSILTAFAQTDTTTAPVFDFRQTNWGMSTAQVKSTEKNKPITDKNQMLVYEGQVSGFDCWIGYIFLDDKLVRAKYLFIQEHSNKTDYIQDYKKIQNILTSKYGEPTADDVLWSNDLYKSDPQEWGMAICIGHLKYYCKWETDATKILLALSGENYKIDFQTEYVSVAHKELIERENKQKDSKDF